MLRINCNEQTLSRFGYRKNYSWHADHRKCCQLRPTNVVANHCVQHCDARASFRPVHGSCNWLVMSVIYYVVTVSCLGLQPHV